MALDDRYFVTSDLSPYFVDKNTGLPLSNGSISFYRDVARNTPKTVYQLIGAPPNYAYVPLPNPVPLSAVGTPQDGNGNDVIIYYFPYDIAGNIDLYYAVVADSSATMNQTIEAWPNNVSAQINPVQNDFSISNQISNAQFTQTFINSNAPTIYSVSAASNQIFSFSPNWDFVISGTGSVTVQRIAIPGNDEVITSPPYVLDITVSGGITVCYLRQRFNENSGLWASTPTQSIFLAGSVVAINQLSGSTNIEMFYQESTGGAPISILQGTFDNSGYILLTGVTTLPIPLSTNTDVGDSGYIDIYLSFLPNSHIRLSSIQVVPSFNPTDAALISFQINSSNREQAFMGDYYIPNLNRRPAASLLTGWDFPVNPFQFAASGNITNTAAYICDQTIALTGTSGNVGYAIDPITGGLQLTTAGNNDAFYLMQYLSGSDAKKILSTSLSVNVSGYVSSASNPVRCQVYLFRAPSTSTIPILPTSIGTVNTGGLFTVSAAGWTAIPRSGLDTATTILAVASTNDEINNLDNDIQFTGWEITDATQIGDTEFFAMVVTFAYIDISTVLTINSISLTPSTIPSRPAPESVNEVLRKCQYYYETSYDSGLFAGAVSNNGAIICAQIAAISGNLVPNSSQVYSRYFFARYQTQKRVPVAPTIYALDGTIANVLVNGFYGPTLVINANIVIAGSWTLANSGDTGFAFQPVDRTVSIGQGPGLGMFLNTFAEEGIVLFHFVADARLGIV